MRAVSLFRPAAGNDRKGEKRNMCTFNYAASFFLIVLGFYTIIRKNNLIKTVIGLSVCNYGVNLLVLSVGYAMNEENLSQISAGLTGSDPVMQTIALLAIVTGACVTAVSLFLVSKIYEYHGTLEPGKIRRTGV